MKLRIVAVVVWGMFLAYFICSLNPFTHHLTGIRFHGHPHYSDLLIMDIHLLDPFWITIKIGHFLGFFILDILLFNLIRKRRIAAMVAVLIAICSEILQLYLGRDGRLYDMIIDTFGVTLAYYIAPRVQRLLTEFLP